MRARVRAFVLTAGELSGAAQGEVFEKALPAIARLIAKTRPPFVANVTASGHVELLDIRKYLQR